MLPNATTGCACKLPGPLSKRSTFLVLAFVHKKWHICLWPSCSVHSMHYKPPVKPALYVYILCSVWLGPWQDKEGSVQSRIQRDRWECLSELSMQRLQRLIQLVFRQVYFATLGFMDHIFIWPIIRLVLTRLMVHRQITNNNIVKI